MVPNHVAIILDGNRRYAKKLGLNQIKGHEYGARKIQDVLGWLRDAGVRQATIYAFSTENFKRPMAEVQALMMVFRAMLKNAKNDPKIDQNRIRMRFIGRLELMPKDIQQGMKELMERTKGYSEFTINFAVAYGGKAEIVDAVKRIAADTKDRVIDEADIDEMEFSRYLYLPDEPDLLIRPGGEKRISNFLLWQLAYSELIFLDKLFPELTKQDVLDCISEYESRERRKGR